MSNHNEDSATLQSYIHSKDKQQSLYKRTLWIVLFSQIFGGAGLAAGITVGALLAKEMLGADSLSGVPIFLFTLGSAAAAFVVGKLSQAYGRRVGLASGFITGGIGAIGVIFSAITNNIWLLFASLLIYGAGSATNLQARYAGTDLATTKQRATAVSVAMVSTTFGAVAGPNLVGVMGEFATTIGVPALAGPFILAAAAFIFAGFVLFIFLRPDPLIIARAIAEEERKTENKTSGGNTTQIEFNKRGVTTAAVVMILTNFIMFAIMTMTPVHMGKHGHDISDVGLVIGFHIGAMFLPSLITGILVDKIGRIKMAVASAITFLASGLLAALSPGDSMLLINLALILLGLGWNLGLISGTALLVDSTNTSNRAKTQGTVDVLVALSGATGGALSGIVVSGSSYATLSIAGGILAFLLVPYVIWSSKSR